MTPGRSPRSTFFTESNVIVSVTAALRHLICEKAIQFVPFVGCFHGYQVGPHIPTRLTSLIPRTVNVMESIGGFPWATWTFRSWNIEASIYQLQLRNRKRTVFLSSYRNTSGSLGEREMLCEHEPQASVSTTFSNFPKTCCLVVVVNLYLNSVKKSSVLLIVF